MRAEAVIYTYFNTHQGKCSDLAKAFKVVLSYYGSAEKVVKALPVVKTAWSVVVWSRVADWPPEALKKIDSGDVKKSLVYELARKQVTDERLIAILQQVSTIPSWEEGAMFVRRVFQEPNRKLSEIKREVSDEYSRETVCLAMVAIQQELKKRLDHNLVEKLVRLWIKKGCPDVPETNITKTSPYQIEVPRWMYERLKEHGNPADVLGGIIRNYSNSE